MWLRSLHATCAAVHLASAITMLGLGVVTGISPARVVTVVALRNVEPLHIETPPPVSMLALLVLCSTVSGLAHAYLAYMLNADSRATGVNPVRWIDYAISSPMMVVVIGLVSGIVDVWTLWGMAAMQSFLMVVNGYLEGTDNRVMPAIMSVYYIVTIWGPVFHAVDQQNVPLFVAWVIATLFLLFASFGVVYFAAMTIQDKMKVELAYAVLSVAAKLSLQWLIYGGADALDGDAEGTTIGVVLSIVLALSIAITIAFSCTLKPY